MIKLIFYRNHKTGASSLDKTLRKKYKLLGDNKI